MIVIDGKLYRNASSVSQTARLYVDDEAGACLKPVDRADLFEALHCRFTDLEISPRLGNTPRYLVFENGDRFETADNDSIDALLVRYSHGKLNRFIHYLESRLHIVLMVAILVMAFVWAFVQYGVPVIAKNAAAILPAESSQYLGQGAIDIMDRTIFDKSELSPGRQKDLASLFQFYAEKYPDYTFKFLFRKGGRIGANAMALPDGSIIFTDEMVALAENDNELVAILGHEIGHVVHRHVLRRIIQDSMLTVVVVMITGDISSASSVIVAMPTILLELAFSREFEREADDFAYDFLIDNKIQTEYFADIMQRLALSQLQDAEQSEKEMAEKEMKGPDVANDKAAEEFLPYLSTHPATSERIQKFQSGNPERK